MLNIDFSDFGSYDVSGFCCQACGKAGMRKAMFAKCEFCKWENDPDLEDSNCNIISVQEKLSKDERNLWSCANNSTANDWLINSKNI